MPGPESDGTHPPGGKGAALCAGRKCQTAKDGQPRTPQRAETIYDRYPSGQISFFGGRPVFCRNVPPYRDRMPETKLYSGTDVTCPGYFCFG